MSRPLFPRMSARLRLVSYLTFGVLWLSGCMWMVLEYFFPSTTEFGPAPNPWQPAILHIHGWIAVATVFVLGWIGASHIVERWGQPRNRVSGYTLVGLATVLMISGYALYYTTESPHRAAALAHEFLGLAAVVFATAHWWKAAEPR